jgi:hypothetical protein
MVVKTQALIRHSALMKKGGGFDITIVGLYLSVLVLYTYNSSALKLTKCTPIHSFIL